MRYRTKAWRAALVAPVVVMLAGCSGGSILPGHGGNGGLGTIGTDTGNPNEGLVFRMPDTPFGDFVADAVIFVSGNPQQIQASQLAGPSRKATTRTFTLRFNTVPVAGATYTVTDDFGVPDGVRVEYSETTPNSSPPNTSTTTEWEGASGQVKISKADGTATAGTFSVQLVPVDPSKPTRNTTGGAFYVKR